jgi:hypothetical protein
MLNLSVKSRLYVVSKKINCLKIHFSKSLVALQRFEIGLILLLDKSELPLKYSVLQGFLFVHIFWKRVEKGVDSISRAL